MVLVCTRTTAGVLDVGASAIFDRNYKPRGSAKHLSVTTSGST